MQISNRLVSLVMLLVAGLLFTGKADAAMTLRGPTSQPIGHFEFCKSYPETCGPNAEIGIIQITDRSWQSIIEVNNTVNEGIIPRTDMEMHGVAELWSYPSIEGDCEDFVLLKQYMLERDGFPRSALLITVVRQPNGEGHAVLTIRTNRGDIILDNLDKRALDWTLTPYKFLKRQSEQNSAKWVAIEDGRDMLVGSVR
ncbi:transglutaminase-like cysteine peptidase [uncultured Aureimonas sp.]|uniref:transglutaminase-like cysteine peptidase n=1 Tax=uncultured Aureimonas sp. TaxID=1604662 RepID=UPI0025FD0F15|nr:transglutaminase-like cysteine peptidase [uncultured Aureimonas sp.]